MSKTSTGTALRVGVSTLRANPLRTILSTLGVVIGVASLVAVLAVGDGMEAYGRESIEKEGIQTIAVSVHDGERVDGVFIARAPTVRLTTADARDLAGALPAGSDVSMRAQRAGLVSHGNANGARARGTMITGILPPAKGLKQLPVAHGRAITRDDAASNARVAVLSQRLADSMAAPGAGASMVGRTLRFSTGAELTVVGVAAPLDLAPRANFVVVPYDVMPQVAVPETGSFARAAQIDVTAAEPAQVAATKAAIQRWAARRYGDRAKELKIEAAASEDRIEQMRRGVLAFKLFMGAIVGISLIVGGIGIMNVMLASVTERTREIGIRKTTGARRRDILEQFLAESVVITSAGAAIGVLLGLGGAFGISALLRTIAQVPIHAAVTGWTLLLAIGVSVGVGLVFGTYPARRAARLSPIEAIRHE